MDRGIAVVSRRPAAFTQADVARAIRAAKQAGAAEVEFRLADGVNGHVVFRREPPTGALVAASVGHVYFIAGGDLIKIGFSRAPRVRFAKMQIECPVELTLLHFEPGTLELERALHRQFAGLRVRGEWFRKASELLAFIEQRKTEAA
jgi:hypothetical protein